jgi:uncharacterized membrane protein YhaH (DUF805 family)
VANGVTRTFFWDGRATRSEYWFYVLFCWLVAAGVVLCLETIEPEADVVVSVVYVALVLMWISLLSAGIRRLHDTGRSGAWVWIVLVPLIGGFWLLLLMTEPPQPHANRFGSFTAP